MSEIYKFPSLAFGDKYGYKFDSMAYSRYPLVHEGFLFFETYGDGMVQHNHEAPIIEGLAADYFASLAAWLLENPDDVPKVRFSLPEWQPSSEKVFEFAASVVYKAPPEGKYAKPKYYSLKELKISSSDSKEYDKRYSRIESWHDGKQEAIMRMLFEEYDRPLTLFARQHALRNWAFKGDGKPWIDIPKLGKDTSREEALKQCSAWELLRGVIDMINQKDYVTRCVEGWKENIQRDCERAAENIRPADKETAA